MLLEKFPKFRALRVQPVVLYQSYHILSIFHDATGMTMLNRMLPQPGIRAKPQLGH